MNPRNHSLLPLAAIAGLALTASTLTAPAKAPINDQLPDTDGKPADMTKPVKVFILLGQSNMLENGKVVGGKDGNLDYAITTEGLYPFLVDDDQNWLTRKDVRSAAVMGNGGPGKTRIRYNDWLTVGNRVGVEQGVGHHLGNHFDEPVLILKSAIGNRSLGWDLLPPGSKRIERVEMVPVEWVQQASTKGKKHKARMASFAACKGMDVEGKTLEQLYDEKFGKVKDEKTGKMAYQVTRIYGGYGDAPGRWFKGSEPDRSGWKAGIQYDGDVARAKEALADLGKFYPGATQFEVAGFIWWQGCKDRSNPYNCDRYELNLGNLVRSLRKDFDAPNAKFVAASLGEDEMGVESGGGKILEAIMNLADPEKHPEFKGSFGGVYSHPLSMGSSSCSHYGGNAKTYMNVGLGLGEKMVELLKNDK